MATIVTQNRKLKRLLRDIKIKQDFEELDQLWGDDGLPISKST